MKKLWFVNSNGHEWHIADCYDWQDANEIIDDFLMTCNDQRLAEAYDSNSVADVQLLKRTQTICQEQEDGRTRIDVGIPDQYFIYEGKKE